MSAQACLDEIEVLDARGVCRAGCLSLADEIEDDIVLRISVAEAMGSLGHGHYPVANQLDAVLAIDLAWGEPRSLLCKTHRDAGDPPEDRSDAAGDLHPCREP